MEATSLPMDPCGLKRILLSIKS